MSTGRFARLPISIASAICSTGGAKNKLLRVAGSRTATSSFNESKRGPLRVEHAHYINFISDFMTDNNGSAHDDAVTAWHEVKAMDAPKTYAAWVRLARRRSPR
jgi:hypothetical protein